MVPKTGKGKYNLTVPVPFDFLNKPKSYSIRQKKVEQMVKQKNREEEIALRMEYRAREIPKHVKQEKFREICEAQEKRKMDMKRLAMAKIKETEKPFSFYERDVLKTKLKSEQAELPNDIPMFPHFKAGKIPWRVLVPIYQTIVDGEDQRQKRIKQNAELSRKMSKLPPRMEAYEKLKKEKEMQEKLNQKKAERQIPPPKEVPDFNRLHREFTEKLLKNKSQQKLTTPQPFNFHEPKNNADLRKYMDDENQKIAPTLKKRSSSARQHLNLNLLEANVPKAQTTKKHEAMAKVRRDTKVQKME